MQLGEGKSPIGSPSLHSKTTVLQRPSIFIDCLPLILCLSKMTESLVTDSLLRALWMISLSHLQFHVRFQMILLIRTYVYNLTNTCSTQWNSERRNGCHALHACLHYHWFPKHLASIAIHYHEWIPLACLFHGFSTDWQIAQWVGSLFILTCST